MQGQFITFEGSDGAGKTTVLNRLKSYLQTRLNGRYLMTREPGGNPIAEQIRSVILDPMNQAMDARTEALLYAASRSQHLSQTIIPALNDGKLVLCDRYIDSSLAYQGGGRQLGLEPVSIINQFATQGFEPSLTIYFDIPVNEGLKRIAKHRPEDQIDRLDAEKIDFHDRVHATYQRLIQNNPERIKVVDATQPVDQVFDQVLKILENNAIDFFK